MTIRAEEPQQEVVIKIDTKGIAWVYLCLNERIKTEEYAEPGKQSKTHTYYEYDGTQFHAPVESLNLQDINNNPQKYDGYEPAKIPSDIERIDAQVTYVRSALCFAIDHCLNGKKASSEYLKAPLMENEEDRVNRLRNEFIEERLKAKQEWDRTHNMIDGKD